MKLQIIHQFKRFSFLLFILLLLTCEKQELVELAEVTTGEVIGIGSSGAQFSGTIVNIGQGISQYGHCWATTSNPTVENDTTSLIKIATTGIYTSNLADLEPGTTYYMRAYAIAGRDEFYGEVISFTTNEKLEDIEGNLYQSVLIGTQEWMAENLKTTTFTDGTPITLVTDNETWRDLNTAAYSWYNNDEATNKPVYGALYNWNAAATGTLCPTGWHVPTDTEWTILSDFLGGISVAGGKLKETGNTHWNSPNTGASNESGFTGLPGGIRYFLGNFLGVGIKGNWWSSSNNYVNQAWWRETYYTRTDLFRISYYKSYGLSIRCIKD